MKNLVNILILSFTGLLLFSCELEESLDDSVVRDEAILEPGEIDPATALNPIYNSLALALNGQSQVTALNFHSSDELIGPTRGTDWYDFGVWTTLHTHQWDPTHPEVLNSWNTLNQGVVRSNQAIVATDGKPRQQARVLRAYLIWHIADLFGQVPFRDENNTDFLTPPQVLPRAEAINLAIEELEAAIASGLLPAASPATYGEPTLEVAHAVLMKLYLNRFIYNGEASASSADMNKVIESADAINGLGSYSLSLGDNYFTENFGLGNEASSENIFVIVNDAGDNKGASFGSRLHQTLHYNQNPSGWNGFTTLGDFYSSFDPQDKRFYGEPTQNMIDNSGLHFGFLQGQQYGQGGNILTERGGAPLVFTTEVPLTGANESNGVRVIKYEPNLGGSTDNTPVDNPLIRYADVWLMEAEAHFRNGDNGVALSMINDLRINRGVDALASLTAEDILRERGFELYWEGHRRNDLIRFGKFTEAWEEKPASEPTKMIFPIPQQAVDSNPNLEQNPGY